MHWRTVGLVFACFCGQFTVHAQNITLFHRDVQIHGFASQGLLYTNTNNWLTTDSRDGSAAFTDFGVNLSTNLTDQLRVGAQLYDRNLGKLGQYHPSLDWAVVDYRFRRWFGLRGGKVKTALGLYNDSQDLDFLRVFALLPQSVYPTDLRDATIAHLGGDIYGNVPLPRRLGDFSYTAYVGHRNDSIYGGYVYLAAQYGLYYSRYGGLQYGGDLRWNTPLKGLLAGISRVDEDITAQATARNPTNVGPPFSSESDRSKADWTSQFYGEYSRGKLRLDSEYRRFVHEGVYSAYGAVVLTNVTAVRGWYVSGTYRINKRLALGSYYSRYAITSVSSGAEAVYAPDQTDTSLPLNHVYDKVISARVDLKKFWNLKLEGHFMNGYGASTFPDGFYPEVNAGGFSNNTNALVVKTGISF